jgi:hypothetical protein
MYNFLYNKWLWLHFGRFFSQTHLVTLLARETDLQLSPIKQLAEAVFMPNPNLSCPKVNPLEFPAAVDAGQGDQIM